MEGAVNLDDDLNTDDTTPSRRRKSLAILGIEETSPARRGTMGSPTLRASTETKRRFSLSRSTKNGERESDEMHASRERISELELALYEAERKAEDKNIELAQAKNRMERLKETQREFVSLLMQCVRDGNSDKLEEIVKVRHGQLFQQATQHEDEDSRSELLDSGRPSETEDDSSATQSPLVKKLTMSTGSTPPQSPKKENSSPLPQALVPAKGSSGSAVPVVQFDSVEGTTLKFRRNSDQLVQGSVRDIVDHLINRNRSREVLARFFLTYRIYCTPAELLQHVRDVALQGGNETPRLQTPRIQQQQQQQQSPSSSPSQQQSSSSLSLQTSQEEVVVVASEDKKPSLQMSSAEINVSFLVQKSGSGGGQSTLRQRVGAFLKCWVKEYFEADFESNSALLQSFAQLAIATDSSLMTLLEAAVQKGRESRRAALLKQGTSLPAMPSELESQRSLFGKRSVAGSIHLTQVQPLDVAKQLTLLEFECFERCEPLEFLRASKDSGKPTAVRGITTRFNRVSSWVATEIVQNSSVKERAAKIKYFVGIASAAREINNFNLIMAVLGGLNFASVQRLKRTWKLVTSKTMSQFVALEQLMSPARNFQQYRMALSKAEGPRLPYVGIVLRDLQFLDVGNDTWVGDKSQGIANFEKAAALESLLLNLESYKVQEFPFPPNTPLQAYLDFLPSLDEEALYKRSLQHEPTNAPPIEDAMSPRSLSFNLRSSSGGNTIIAKEAQLEKAQAAAAAAKDTKISGVYDL